MEVKDQLIRRRIKQLKAIVFDVDGVLTDGSMYYSEQGEAMKKFNTKDGMGISLLIKKGIQVAFITGEDSKIALRRAEKLGVEDVYLGVKDKTKALDDFLTKHGISPDQTAYVGDDLNDLEAMKRTGVSFTVKDAPEKIKQIANLTSSKDGGNGAVREIADLILETIG